MLRIENCSITDLDTAIDQQCINVCRNYVWYVCYDIQGLIMTGYIYQLHLLMRNLAHKCQIMGWLKTCMPHMMLIWKHVLHYWPFVREIQSHVHPWCVCMQASLRTVPHSQYLWCSYKNKKERTKNWTSWDIEIVICLLMVSNRHSNIRMPFGSVSKIYHWIWFIKINWIILFMLQPTLIFIYLDDCRDDCMRS